MMAVLLIICVSDFPCTMSDVDCFKTDSAGAMVRSCVGRGLSNINERRPSPVIIGLLVDEECPSDIVDSSSANRRNTASGNSEKPEDVETIGSSKPKLLCCMTEVPSSTLLHLPVKL